jgi:hypothetical protein
MNSKKVPFNCTVNLRQEFDKAQPVKVKEIKFHQQNSSEGLDLILKQAQLLLLNPSFKYTHHAAKTLYETIKIPQQNEIQFTRNVVCVEISGTDLDLTLIDLPGIIQSVGENEDIRMIKMITDLVHFYIKKERALILAVITCKDEIENQAIFHMAKQHDPSGSRTIGIFN